MGAFVPVQQVLEPPAPVFKPNRRLIMVWQTPAACDMRFGFEITMYIATR